MTVQGETIRFNREWGAGHLRSTCPHVQPLELEWRTEIDSVLIPYGLLVRTWVHGTETSGRLYRSPVDGAWPGWCADEDEAEARLAHIAGLVADDADQGVDQSWCVHCNAGLGVCACEFQGQREGPWPVPHARRQQVYRDAQLEEQQREEQQREEWEHREHLDRQAQHQQWQDQHQQWQHQQQQQAQQQHLLQQQQAQQHHQEQLANYEYQQWMEQQRQRQWQQQAHPMMPSGMPPAMIPQGMPPPGMAQPQMAPPGTPDFGYGY